MRAYDIPQHWQTLKLRQILRPYSEKNHPELPLLSVVREKGVIVRNTESKEENHNYIPEDLSGYKRVKAGQFAMNKMKAWQGSYGISKYEGIVSPAYFVFDVITGMNLDFFNLAIRSKVYVSFFGRASDGIRVGQWDLSIDRMKEIPFFVPPREEQDQIVRFLDWKVSEINRLIAIIKSSIRCLHQAKSKLINNCITSVTSRIKLKHIARCNCATLGESTEPEYSFRYIDIGSVDYTKGITKYETFTFKNAPSRARRIVKKHDIIISTVRTYLKAITTIYDDADVIVSTGFAVVQPDPNLVDSRFLEYCCKSDWFCDEVIRHSNGVAYPAITSDALMNLQIPFCSYDEQKAIVSHLDVECSKLDCIISNKEKTISKLQELKNRLISDVVTGKIDVRGIEIPEYTAEVADTDSEAEAEELDEGGEEE